MEKLYAALNAYRQSFFFVWSDLSWFEAAERAQSETRRIINLFV
jgi:hypothetical protein